MDYSFNMKEALLSFNPEKGMLTSKTPEGEKKQWVKKIEGIVHILSVIEDKDNYYAACEIDDITGELIALDRQTGTTRWYIPGRPYLQQLFDKDLFTIFVDSEQKYFLLRVTTDDGSSRWHHPVSSDLLEYTINKDLVTLHYASGQVEKLNSRTGVAISRKNI